MSRPSRVIDPLQSSPRFRSLSDPELLDLIQHQTFRYFWEGAHPVSGLARDRTGLLNDPANDIISIGGSGFGILAIIVACERGWVQRKDAVTRLAAMLDCLERATCYHGMFPHFMNGATGATIPFSRKDDGADIVETSFLFQGLLCARAYFNRDDAEETRLRQRVTNLWQEAEWDWFIRDSHKVLAWHWSPNNGWALNHEIRGWNECLLTYVLAASSPRYSISLQAYQDGWAEGRQFLNRRSFDGIYLPLGPDWGGPLFFAHFSFCGIDPRGLSDSYADYWQQNVNHTLINYAHCVRNPHGYVGYGPTCWGLTASDTIGGYAAHAPDNDLGVISPAAALASFPYAPSEAMSALRNFYENLGDRIWGRFGFVDAFSEEHEWYAETYLAISQGPVVAMIENYRSGLLWQLFMNIPEVQAGLKKLGFTSPYWA